MTHISCARRLGIHQHLQRVGLRRAQPNRPYAVPSLTTHSTQNADGKTQERLPSLNLASLILGRGDLVGLRTKSRLGGYSRNLLGVVTSLDPCSCVLGNGQTFSHALEDVWFHVSNFEPLLGETDAGPVPMATLPKIIKFYTDSHQLVIKHKAQFLRVAEGRIQKWTVGRPNPSISLYEMAKMLFRKSEPVATELYACYMLMIKSGVYFSPQKFRFLQLGRFRVRSESEIRDIVEFRNEYANRTEDYVSFFQKLADRSRGKGPIQWTEKDMRFAKLLFTFRMEGRSEDSPLFFVSRMLADQQLGGTFQLEDTEKLEYRITDLLPYSEYDCWIARRDCPVEGLENEVMDQLESTSKGYESQILATRKFEKYVPGQKKRLVEYIAENQDVNSSRSRHELQRVDDCKAIREDFCNHFVISIDPVDAKEIDDAMSIEWEGGVPSDDPKKAWIHIHIADPSAYIPPSHPLMEVAELRASSIYFPERHFPMLPSPLSDKLCSLGLGYERGGVGAGDCTLTFSVKIDERGDIVDSKVRPGFIGKVHKVPYEVADALVIDKLPSSELMAERPYTPWKQTVLGIDPSKDKEEDPRGSINDHPELANNPSLQEKITDTLIQIHNIVVLRRRKRFKNGAIAFADTRTEVKVSPYPLRWIEEGSDFSPQDLDIEMKYPTYQSRSLTYPFVAECMILAGRAAARFCSERGIPVPYRTQPTIFDVYPRITSMPMEDPKKLSMHMRKVEVAFDKYFRQKVSDTGLVSGSVVSAALPLLRAASHNLDPFPHSTIGFPDGYVRVTSPLRRAMDIVVHHQIKAFLRERPFPYSRARLQAMIDYNDERQGRIRIASRMRNRFWQAKLVQLRRDSTISGFVEKPMGSKQYKIRMEYGDLIVRAKNETEGLDPRSELRMGDKVTVSVDKIVPQWGVLQGTVREVERLD